MNSQRLCDIFTPSIISVAPDTHVNEVIESMHHNSISCVVVLEDQKPIGIVTERNIVKYAVGRDEKCRDCLASDLMSSPVVTAHRDMDVFEAHNLFSNRKIRHLIVVDNHSNAIGVVTQSDIVMLLSLESLVDIKTIDEVMSRDVFVVSRDASLSSSLKEMSKRSVSCIVVVSESKPIGILTERDIGRLLIQYKELSSLRIEEVMSKSIKTVSKMISLNEAVDQMRSKKLRRLVVVDDDGNIEGLATQSDLVKGLEGKYIERLHKIINQKNEIIYKTAQELADKSIYLNNILNSSVDHGLIALDLNFRMLLFNSGAEKILGLKADEVIGQDARTLPPWGGGKILRSKEIMNILRQRKPYSYIHEHNRGSESRFISLMASPITDMSNNLTGFLLIANDITEKHHTAQQLKLAHQNLEKRVFERTKQLENAMESAIHAIAKTVELRDPYTSGHQKRVADLASLIATEMGLSDEKVEGVYMAGLIHDIGKIRVPTDILCHPGKLSEAEFGILKPHPAMGHNILKGIEFPWPVAEIVLQHHERIDGSGYPLGVRGNQIMIKAKILAVADVVEAMSSHRPYRPALGIELALKEIDSKKGVSFDSEVVNACLNIFKKNNYAFPSSFRGVD